jgi:hypothetical protein
MPVDDEIDAFVEFERESDADSFDAGVVDLDLGGSGDFDFA